MDLETALTAALQADAGVGALVADRIYPQLVPQDATLPAIAYQVITTDGMHTHNGTTPLVRATVQLAIIASTYATAKQIRTAAKTLLDNFKGVMGGVGGLQIEECFVSNEVDGYNAGTSSKTVRMDLEILHQGE